MARSLALGGTNGATAAPKVRPPGHFVDVGGHRLHVVCRGSGGPPVVLEAGIAASSLSWTRVQPELAALTRVCAYDRAGLGWSDAPSTPRTFDRILAELVPVVTAAGNGQPVVLAGHSFGSLIVRGYAARHPEQVAGLVLVDPPTEWIEGAPERTRLLRRAIQASTLGVFLARVGVVRASLALLTGGLPAVPRTMVKALGPRASGTLERLVGEVRKLPPELYPVVKELWCQPKCFRSMAEHLRVLEREGSIIGVASPPPHIPVVVISGGHQPAGEIAAHRRLAAASPRGRHLVAEKSGHWVLFDEPAIVVEAVRDLLSALA